MGDLPNPTVDAIYSHYETQTQERRGYLGGSRIGEECRRMLWYDFRWAGTASFMGRILRLFETGHREEERMIANLKAIGCTVEGDQFEVIAIDGHLQAHFDGVVLGLPESPETWHLLETKTSNRKGFDLILKKGVKEAKPVHYAQMQLSMGLGELTRAAYLVHCKDTDRLYFERIKFDKAFFEGLLRKAKAIVYDESLPDRLSNDPSFWKCKFCDHAKMCHGPIFPEINCRTCVHSKPVKDAKWECAHGFDHMVNEGVACGSHLYIPSLLHWEAPIDGAPDWIEYGDFINGICDRTDKQVLASRDLKDDVPF